MENSCQSGHCNQENQTRESCLKFMKENNQNVGIAFFLHKDEGDKRGYRKDLVIDVPYKRGLAFQKGYEGCVAYNFIPYGIEIALPGETKKTIVTRDSVKWGNLDFKSYVGAMSIQGLVL